MTQNAKVIEINGSMATVEVGRTSACDGCHQKDSCPTHGKKIRCTADNAAGASVGDIVEISSPDGIVLIYAVLTFVLPLFIGIAVYFLLSAFGISESAVYIATAATFAICLVVMSFILNVPAKKRMKHTVTKIIDVCYNESENI